MVLYFYLSGDNDYNYFVETLYFCLFKVTYGDAQSTIAITHKEIFTGPTLTLFLIPGMKI